MIKVLVVDDSSTARRVISESLSEAEDITVVATAADPYEAREMMLSLNPDVLTLDLEMPRLDGLTFLERIMRYRPMPVVVISSLTRRGSEEAIKALELGAVDVLCKPGSAYDLGSLGRILASSVRAAAKATPRPWQGALHTTPCASLPTLARTTNKIVAVGASTGGTQAIREFLEPLPADAPGMVIVQHMPPMFTRSFADRLDEMISMRVHEAVGGEEIMPGMVYIAPGGKHLEIKRSGARYQTVITNADPVHFHRPSVDVLFHSVAREAGKNAVGVLLTGMGEDGADGLLAMRNQGARTFAQDEHSAIVYGMPCAAAACGAVEKQGSPADLAEITLNAVAEMHLPELNNNPVDNNEKSR